MKRARAIPFNVGGVKFVVSSRNWETRTGAIPDLIDDPMKFIDRDPAIFPVFLTHIRGYDLDDDFIKQAGVNSGYLPRTFYSMLYQDCRLYQIPEVTNTVEYFLLENMPDLLDRETLEKLSGADAYRDKVHDICIQNQEIIEKARDDIGMGDLELDDDDIERMNRIDIASQDIENANYVEMRDHNEFLKATIGRKKSRQKVKGMFPQILIWITTMVYKWLGINNSQETISSKIRMFLRSHPRAVDELCNSIDQFGWDRAEPIIDYAMMAAVDASMPSNNEDEIN